MTQVSDLLLRSDPGCLNLGLLVLRVSLGICFFIHGLGKLGIVGPGGPGALQGFEGWLRSLGLPMPRLQARMAMLTEIVGGILITVGLLTRPAAVALAATMVVAAFVGHRGGGYLITNTPPGNEYALNMGILMIVLTLMGPGTYSLDSVWFG